MSIIIAFLAGAITASIAIWYAFGRATVTPSRDYSSLHPFAAKAARDIHDTPAFYHETRGKLYGTYPITSQMIDHNGVVTNL
jgi:hypothetical protein